VLDVDGASNFGADVVFAGAAANITFDQSTDDLIFDDNAKAIFGSSSDGLEILHDGSNSFISDTGTGNLNIDANTILNIRNASSPGQRMAKFTATDSVELYFNANKKFETTNDGILVGSLSTVQTNGNAAFAGITTIGTLLDANGRIDAASGANISGIATITNAYITN